MLRLFGFAVFLSASAFVCAQTGIPAAPKRPVTDQYHGVKVTDDYRWLEDWSNNETRDWSDSENAHARHYLDALPGRERLRDQIKAILSAPSAHFDNMRRGGGVLFALRFRPPKEQPFLVTLPSVNEPDSARVILDPAQLDPSGHTAIDFYVPSPDGKYVAVSLSKGGSESGDLSIYETGSGKALPDVIPLVNGGTAGGSVAWKSDDSGIYYTRYPHEGERPAADINFYQQIWFHRLGTNTSADKYSLGKEFPRIAEITLRAQEHGGHILATVANGDGGEFSHYLLSPNGKWIQIARLSDQVTAVHFGMDKF